MRSHGNVVGMALHWVLNAFRWRSHRQAPHLRAAMSYKNGLRNNHRKGVDDRQTHAVGTRLGAGVVHRALDLSRLCGSGSMLASRSAQSPLQCKRQPTKRIRTFDREFASMDPHTRDLRNVPKPSSCDWEYFVRFPKLRFRHVGSICALFSQ